ncbi:MAG: excinuclease ABC subunit C [Halobacteriaceae archaeon]
MDADAVRRAARELPDEPGVYQFRDGDRTLYVGKAVSLRDRVRSYADPRSARIARMVERAADVEAAVTDTETQALLLEANLIKRFQPRYNVRLTDDKSYPMVQLTDHDAPRVEVTRDPEETARVFGPFTDVGRVETVVKALRDVFGVRGCSDHKYRNRDRPCLDYDMGLCTAPCTGEIGAEAYLADVESVRRFLEGETAVLAEPLRAEMERAADAEEFERAATLRDRLAAVEALHDGATGREGGVLDVLGVAVEGSAATVVRLRSEGGGLVDRDRRRLDTPEGGGAGTEAGPVLGAFVVQFYAERDLPDALLLPEELPTEVEEWLAGEGVEARVPGAGREAELVDLALQNAHRGVAAGDDLDALAAALDLPRPERIEGMDVSHAGGSSAVGSDVVFVDGTPEKRDYRRKRLPAGNDDYANVRALVAWRAERAREGRDDRPDPDLLLVDGGRGQLEAARDALDEHDWDVPAVALAKAEEVVYAPDRRFDWDGDAPQLHVLQRVRDEAHRFAVQYHRTLRDDVSTALDDVPGVGPELRTRLLRRFGSVDGVRAASTGELQSVEGVGEATAETIAEEL